MTKWIFIVMLLEQSPVTGEVQWAEAVRIENISYETCIGLVAQFPWNRGHSSNCLLGRGAFARSAFHWALVKFSP